MIRDEWDVSIQIKDELKKSLIFGFQSRLSIGEVLSFVGYRHEVLPILQKLSHGTRAYVWNADGLKGFVQRIDICVILNRVAKTKEYQEMTKFQVFDLAVLEAELEPIQ